MRRSSRNSLVRVAVPLTAVLILSVAFAALAQITGTGHQSAQDAAVPAGLDAAATRPPVYFSKVVTYPSGGYMVWSVAVADLNGDGHPDLIVANLCQSIFGCDIYNPDIGEVGVLLGRGDGTFQPTVGYSSGGYLSYSVAVGDVNGDGKPDLVVANGCQDSDCNNASVSVLLGNGDGTFQPAVNYGWAGYIATSVAIGDLNGDGHPDLVVGSGCPEGGCTNGAVGVLLGNGDGTFQPPVTYSSGGFYGWVAIGDVNGDGKPDLVVANSWGTVGVLLGNGDGTFQAPVNYGSGGFAPLSVTIGDVNGDGKPDLLVANCGTGGGCYNGLVGVLLGNGDGTFQPAVSYSSGGSAQAIAIADVNGDGHPDLVVANCGLAVLLGNGDGTFQAPVGYNSGGICGDSVAVADLNGDGRPDVVIGNWGSSSVGVLLNNFSAKTTTAVTSSLNPSPVGQQVTFTATVIAIGRVPDGSTVTFYRGPTVIGTGTTTNGVASLTTSFSKAGGFQIKASYPGGPFQKPSSGRMKQVVKH